MKEKSESDKAAVLVLEDGNSFSGYLLGSKSPDRYEDKGFGEVVFNTSMTGYQEVLTDPSYYGQIICMTASHIGNTGVNSEDHESRQTFCAGFIVHSFCETPSSWRSNQTLAGFLLENNIPTLYGVDTRGLTRHLRSQGVVRGILLPKELATQGQQKLRELPTFEGRDLIAEVSTKTPYSWPLETRLNGKHKYDVVALDFGIKWNLLRCLEDLGCKVRVMPANTESETILNMKPDGLFLSNGPGDPTAAPYAVKTIRQLLGKVPIFGVCMGHQLLALALGAKTYKLKFGHRGSNQPVLNHTSNKVEISSHNHGYAVDPKSVPSKVQITHTNLNDHTLEGISLEAERAFSVQYHPEACPGPHDSRNLFQKFVDLMEMA